MYRLLIFITLTLLLAACAGAATPTSTPTAAAPEPQATLSLDPTVIEAEYAALPVGVAENGKELFTGRGCVACHSLEEGVRVVGPSMAGLGARAATTEPDVSAEVYLYKSITRPNATVTAGFAPGLMPQNFKGTLPPQELADLIAYLLTLK
jgi:nitric oxide reductase subunit C